MHSNEVKERCRHLRAAAPREWDAFVAMFAEYTAEAIDAVSEAGAETIMTQKGFALANKAWLKTFSTLDVSVPVQPLPAPIPAAAIP